MKLEILQSCPSVIRDFLTYNETIKGKSSRSVEGYFLDLQTFFRYLLTVRGKVARDTEFEEIDISSVDIELIKTNNTAMMRFIFFMILFLIRLMCFRCRLISLVPSR